MSVYLDYNATTPVLTEIADLVYKMMVDDFGNAGSRTHEYGVKAKRAVETARQHVADVVGADKTEVIFTSGATESNNIAILGLRDYAEQTGKKHIITSRIEHKAVLEPVEHLESCGFEVSYLDVDASGSVSPRQLQSLLRKETGLVSVMHINNETGCIQPLAELCEVLKDHDAYLHVDAAQSFGKFRHDLTNSRIDLISASGHKIYAPKGIGALIMRRRGYDKVPLKPISFGGGQERGLRPGTLAAPLVAGFGLACEIAAKSWEQWLSDASSIKESLKLALVPFNAVIHGDNTSPFVMNFSIPGVNSEALMVTLKGIAAVSNGSACTSNSYTPSHVLTAMGLSSELIAGSVRMSWGVGVKELPIDDIVRTIKTLQG